MATTAGQNTTMNISPTRQRRKRRSWDDLYLEVKKIYEATGGCPAPGRDHALLRWMDTQRRNRHKLSEQRRALLDAIGFDWTTTEERREEEWKAKFEKCVVYQKKSGHLPEYSTNSSLAKWLDSQKTECRKGNLRPDRQKKLEDIGVVLPQSEPGDARANQEEKWNMNFERYRELKEKGQEVTPHSCDDRSFVSWVNNQRHAYRTGILRQDRRQKFDSIGVQWIQSEKPSAERQQINASTNGKTGDKQQADVSTVATATNQVSETSPDITARDSEKDPVPVSKANDVSQDYEEKPSQPKLKWSAMYKKLQEYKKLRGTFEVPPGTNVFDEIAQRERSLDSWVNKQRLAFQEGTLNESRRARLEEIGFPFHLKTPLNLEAVSDSQQSFEEMFDALCIFKVDHGHCNVSEDDQRRRGLFLWLRKQEKLHSQGGLSTQKLIRLKAVGFRFCDDTNAKRKSPSRPIKADVAPPRVKKLKAEQPRDSAEQEQETTHPGSRTDQELTSRTNTDKRAEAQDDKHVGRFVGRRVSKHFSDGNYSGTVMEHIPASTTAENLDLWNIKYDDGDEEDMDEKQVLEILVRD